MQVATPIAGSKAQVYLIAKGRDLDLNALNTYTLEFEHAISAENTIPILVRIFRKRGIVVNASIDLSLNKEVVKTIDQIALSRLSSNGKQLLFNLNSDLLAAFPNDGSYSVTVRSLNGSSATIDVELYGLKI